MKKEPQPSAHRQGQGSTWPTNRDPAKVKAEGDMLFQDIYSQMKAAGASESKAYTDALMMASDLLRD